MVAEVIETPTETPVDPSTVETQTETPPAEIVEERAAETPPEDATPQLEITPEKPVGMTREEAEKFFEEKAERIRADAAVDALEQDRKRRQTENARKANAEEQARKRLARTVDTVRTAFGAKGIYEDPSEAVVTAIDREVEDRVSEAIRQQADPLKPAWDYLLLPVTKGRQLSQSEVDSAFAELDEPAQAMYGRLRPMMQQLVNGMRPMIEAQAREGYIAESELPKRIEQFNAAKAAKSREGQEELKHVEGAPVTNNGSLANWETRVAHQGEDGYPHLSESDWNEYRSVRRASGL